MHDLESVLARMKQQRAGLVVVYVDRLARTALDPILARLDSIGVLLSKLELFDPPHVEHFVGSSNVDSPAAVLTARQLAVAAFQRADQRGDDRRAIGLAISTTTAGGGHLVVHSRRATHQCTFRFPPQTTPSCQIEQLRGLIVEMLAREFGLAADQATEPGSEQGSTAWLRQPAQRLWQELVSGARLLSGACPDRPVLFPGSFHPVHQGHRQMKAIAAARLNQPIHMEISVSNADKPALDFLTIAQRVRDAESMGPVVLTMAPRFVDKARLFPGATFLVGADTTIRLDDVRFYDNSAKQRDKAIGRVAEHGCRFLVFGRLVGETFHDATQLVLSAGLRELCEFVPATEFRVDISSRQLRRNDKSNHDPPGEVT